MASWRRAPRACCRSAQVTGVGVPTNRRRTWFHPTSRRDSHKRYYGTSGSSPHGMGHFEAHSVETRLDLGRQLAAQMVVVEISVQVREDGAARLEALDPGERVADREVARVWAVTQRIDNPHVEPGERGRAFVRHAAEVARVADIA